MSSAANEGDALPENRRPLVTPLTYQDEVLGTLDLPARALIVTRGLGSGMTSRAGDPPGTVWAVGDRGPNLKVKLAIGRYGLRHLEPLRSIDGAKIMPMLDVGPAISELRVSRDEVVHVRTIPLRDTDGTPLSGLPIPSDFSEPAFDIEGRSIVPPPGGADTEGIAACADGSFWVADEYGPSLLHVAPDGLVIERLVPQGCARNFEGVGYPVVEALPAIAARRQLNRGFEALALSADGASLTLAFQSPLAHPDEAAHRAARHVRIWRLDLATRQVAAQHLYPLDDPDSFRRDRELGEVDRSDIKVSELVTLAGNRLLVLERGSATTKLYIVAPTLESPIDAGHLDLSTRPTIEESSALDDRAIASTMLTKTLVLSSDDHPEIGADIEGLALLGDRRLLLVNDNDFGIEGIVTRFWRVDLD